MIEDIEKTTAIYKKGTIKRIKACCVRHNIPSNCEFVRRAVEKYLEEMESTTQIY